MPKNTNACFLEDLEGVVEKKSLVQRYLQNPFSLPWSKLTVLFQSTSGTRRSEVAGNTQPAQFAQSAFNPIQEQDLCLHFNVQTQYLVFDTNLQEFARKVSYICAFHTGGKLSTEQAYTDLDQLWKQLEQSKNT